MSTDIAIELENVSKTYKLKFTSVKVLNNINLKVERGKILCVMGPSGSGKTSLLRASSGLLKPDTGKVKLFGEDIYNLNEKERLNMIRTQIAFMFQEDLLIDTLSVRENVELPLIIEGCPKKIRLNSSLEALAAVRLEKIVDRKPTEISGGERRRVSLARCLVKKFQILFADEVTSNIDTEMALRIISILKELNNEGKTIIISTHDLLVAKHFGNIVNIRDGMIQSV